MKSEDQIKQLAKDIRIEPDAGVDERVLTFAEAVLAKSTENQDVAALRRHSIWRKIMKSPVTKLAAAAVIIIACSTGLILWRSTGSDIVLADVLTKVEQITGYMYRLSSTVTKQQNTSKWVHTVFITEDGIKLTVEMMNPEPKNKEFPLPDVYLLPKKNALIALSHETKTFFRMKYEDTMMESYKEKYNDPTAIIKQILSCNHTSLGKSVVDGVSVEGFQTTDPAYKGGFFGQAELQSEPVKVDVKIWVNMSTFLPVRSEEDILTKDGMHIHEVNSDFHWNVPVDETGFEPEVPDDYKSPVGDIVVPALNEKTAIKGLKLFADLTGEYPDDLSRETIYENEEVKKKLKDSVVTSWKNLSDEEKTDKTKITNDYQILFRLAYFYETLNMDKKDPAYYGQSVTPKETNLVLLRWKVSDNKYRVIFGDLSVKDVTAEELAELEKLSAK
jgi:hypothetical protein